MTEILLKFFVVVVLYQDNKGITERIGISIISSEFAVATQLR